MRVSEQQASQIARALVDRLLRADLGEFPEAGGAPGTAPAAGPAAAGSQRAPAQKVERAVTEIAAELFRYSKLVATLDADAERLADEHLRAAAGPRGRELVGVDRRRVVRMIKEKLAAERNVPI